MPSGPEMDWRSDTFFANGGYTVLPFKHCPWCGRIL